MEQSPSALAFHVWHELPGHVVTMCKWTGMTSHCRCLNVSKLSLHQPAPVTSFNT